MSIKQAIEALEVAQDTLDISQSLQESAKSNHHPKTLAAYERVSAALAALRSMPQGEPVATIRYERGTPGKENDMPKVVSCNWLPDGVYSVYATPHTEAVRMSEAEERAAFEAWATSKGIVLTTHESDGEYLWGTARDTWEAWQAASATPHTAPVPDAWQPLSTLPKDGTLVLFHILHGKPHLCRADDYQHMPYWLELATHWMPIPPTPVEQATAARLGVKSFAKDAK